MDKRKKIILIILLIIAFFLNGIIYQQGRFPLHADEYAHLAQARDIVQSGSIRFVNPYFQNEPFLLRLESGFHIFLAFFIILFKENTILIFNILRNFVFVLNTFLIFLLSYKISKNYTVGIFSAIFFMLLKSTPSLLGNAFLLPLNLGLTLFLTTMIFFIKYKAESSKKILLFFILFFILLIITYPPASILAFMIIVINQIVEIKDKKNFKNPLNIIMLSFAIIGLVISFAIKTILKLPISELINKFFIFSKNWTPLEFTSSPFSFFGITASVLAFIGLIQIIFKKQKNNKIILIGFLVILVDIYLFYVSSFSLFIPFTRLIFFFVVTMCILTGVGLNYLIIKLNKFIKNKKVGLVIISFFIISIFALQIISLYDNKGDIKPIILDEEKYDVMKFMRENYGKENVVIADPLTSFAIYPLTGNYVLGLLESNIGSGNREEQNKFFVSECEEKQNIISHNNITLVISKEEINCKFLNKIYQKGKIGLYKLITN